MKREPMNQAGRMGKIAVQPAKVMQTVDPLERMMQKMAGRTHGRSMAGMKQPMSMMTRKV
jgi:hypothetical protein